LKAAQQAPATGSMFTADRSPAAAQVVARDAEIVLLESQVNDLTAELKAKAQATADLKESTEQLLGLEGELAMVNAEKRGLNDRVSAAEGDMQARVKQLADANAKLAAATQMNKDLSAELDATKRRLTEANQRFTDANQSVADLQTQVDAAENSSGDVAVAKLTADLAARKQDLDDAVNARVVAEEALVQSKNDTTALRAELNAQFAVLECAHAQVRRLTTERDDLVKALAKLGAENAELQTFLEREKTLTASEIQRAAALEIRVRGFEADLKKADSEYDLICAEDEVLKGDVTRLTRELKAANDRVSNIEKDLNASNSELLEERRAFRAATVECDKLKEQLEGAGVAVPKPLNAQPDSWIGQHTPLRPVTLTTLSIAEQSKISSEATKVAKSHAKSGTANAVKSFAGSVFTGLVGVGKLAMSDPGAKKVPPMELGSMSSAKSANDMMTTDNNFEIPPLVKQAQDVCMSVLVAEGKKCAKLSTSFTKNKKSMMFTYNGKLVWVCRENDDGNPMTGAGAGTRVMQVGSVGEKLIAMDDCALNYQTVQYEDSKHADAVAAVRFLAADKKGSVPEVVSLIIAFD
jgi:predicted  nucleic acid-binding Zn-ribbon protein